MNIKKALFLTLAIVFINSESAFAGLVLSPSVFYSQEKDKDETGDEETKLTIYDIKLGYTFPNNFYFGAIFVKENKDYVNGEEDITATGASFGYYTLGFYLIGHYFFKTEREDSGANETESGDSGMQFDFGYLYSMGGSFALGPQVSYKKYEFDSVDPGNQSVSRSKTRLLPMINLALFF